MSDTLTDDLRTALRHRAAEIPDADAPGLVLGYTAAPPEPTGRRWALVVSGAVAAGLLTVAFVSGSGDPSATPLATQPTTSMGVEAPTDVLRTITSGEAAGRTWQLVVVQHDGHELVQLRAEGLEGNGGIAPREAPAGMGYVSGAVRGDAWRFPDGQELVVAVVAPEIEGITVEGGITVTADAVADPAHPEGWRYVVLEAPPGAEHVRVRLHLAGGGEADPVELDVSRPVGG